MVVCGTSDRTEIEIASATELSAVQCKNHVPPRRCGCGSLFLACALRHSRESCCRARWVAVTNAVLQTMEEAIEIVVESEDEEDMPAVHPTLPQASGAATAAARRSGGANGVAMSPALFPQRPASGRALASHAAAVAAHGGMSRNPLPPAPAAVPSLPRGSADLSSAVGHHRRQSSLADGRAVPTLTPGSPIDVAMSATVKRRRLINKPHKPKLLKILEQGKPG